MHIIIGGIVALAGAIWVGIQVFAAAVFVLAFIAHIIGKARFLMNRPG